MARQSFQQIESNFSETYAQNYSSNFVGVPNNTCYIDPLGTAMGNNTVPASNQLAEVKSKIHNAKAFAYDRRAELNFNYSKRQTELKAMTSTIGGAGTTDSVMNPFSLDPTMWDLSRRELPARTIIRRVTNYGPLAVWNSLDSKGNANHSEAFYNELQPNEYQDSEYTRYSTQIKLLRRAGVTSGFANATIPSFTTLGFNYTAGAEGTVGNYSNQATSNAIDRNVVERTKAVMEDEEWAIFNGDSSVNPKEFDGMIKIIGTNNEVDLDGEPLKLKDFRECTTKVRQNGGYVDIAFTDLKTYDETIELILDTKQGIVDYGDETEYGFNYVRLRVGSGRVKLIGSQFMTVLDDHRRVLMLDSRTWEMRVVQDITYMPMGRQLDGDSFIVKMYEALICKAVPFNGVIAGIGVEGEE